MQIFFIDQVLPTTRHTEKIFFWGGGSVAIQTESDSSLHIYFATQIPPFIDWSCTVVLCAGKEYILATAEMAGKEYILATAEMTEYVSRFSVERCGSHP